MKVKETGQCVGGLCTRCASQGIVVWPYPHAHVTSKAHERRPPKSIPTVARYAMTGAVINTTDAVSAFQSGPSIHRPPNRKVLFPSQVRARCFLRSEIIAPGECTGAKLDWRFI